MAHAPRAAWRTYHCMSSINDGQDEQKNDTVFRMDQSPLVLLLVDVPCKRLERKAHGIQVIFIAVAVVRRSFHFIVILVLRTELHTLHVTDPTPRCVLLPYEPFHPIYYGATAVSHGQN